MRSVPLFVLGGGSNLLISDAGFEWAGDTVGAMFMDASGNYAHGTAITDVYRSADAQHLAAWPADGSIAGFPFASGTIEGRNIAEVNGRLGADLAGRHGHSDHSYSSGNSNSARHHEHSSHSMSPSSATISPISRHGCSKNRVSYSTLSPNAATSAGVWDIIESIEAVIAKITDADEVAVLEDVAERDALPTQNADRYLLLAMRAVKRDDAAAVREHSRRALDHGADEAPVEPVPQETNDVQAETPADADAPA